MTTLQNEQLDELSGNWCHCKQEKARQLWVQYKEEKRISAARMKKLAENEVCKSEKNTLPNMRRLSQNPRMLLCSDGITVALRLVQLEINFLNFCECSCEKQETTNQ